MDYTGFYAGCLIIIRSCHENRISVNYKSLVGSTEFDIDNDDNDWSEDIQFELQTSNWDDQKKFRIIANGRTIIEKVHIFFYFLRFINKSMNFSLHKMRP